jgi:hypothetical protein
MVSRHVMAHAHDSLLHAGGEKAHPEESYFVPPLRDRLDTGDLLDFEGSTWIVVTPRCDLAHDNKTDTVLFARCEDISGSWNALVGVDSTSAADKRRKLQQHGASAKQHFLPQMRDSRGAARGPWLAQFHSIKAVAAADALKEFTPKRFASLAPQFVPSLVERFGGFFSRIGTPDLT